MNDGSVFNIFGRGRARGSKPEDLQPFMELLPGAVLALDPSTGRVLVANQALAKLAGRDQAELQGAETSSLFKSWGALTEATPEAPARFHTPFKRRGQPSLLTYVVAAPIASMPNVSLALVIPAEEEGLPSGVSGAAGWDSLCSMVTALEEQDLEPLLDKLIEAARIYSGGDWLAIYHLANSPILQRRAVTGEATPLPEALGIQELMHYNTLKHWGTGRRAQSDLQRIARGAGLAYLVGAPVGPAHALVGLAVIAGRQPVDPVRVEGAARLLAAGAGVALQQQSRHSALSNNCAELLQRDSTLQTLEHNLWEGVILLGPDLHIRRMNQAAERMLGYTNRQVVNQPVDQVLIGPQSLEPALSAAQVGSSTPSLDDIRLYRRNGEAFLVRLRLTPVLSHDQVTEIIIYLEDISEQEQDRLRAQTLEERAMLGQAMAVFAHEVRNPISSIDSTLQWLALSLPPEDPTHPAIERMREDCDRLEALMKNMLNSSKPVDSTMTPLSVIELLKRQVDRLQERMKNLNIQADVQVTPDCPMVMGSLRSLEQVFNNLVNNAIRAMEKTGGNLVLRAHPIMEEVHEFVEISVADTGPGIPKDQQERIFQPFVSNDPTGTGLGLAITRRILTAHKGDIRLESFPGGTIFTVRLPAISSK